MCGISGYCGPNGDSKKLGFMAKALERRGPDDEGFYEAPGIGFGFRRLSIIDLKTGHQPISNENETVSVMLNGEIYGFKKLRDELISLGYKFKTTSDTEVILHAYEKWGEECFKNLNGMFAISIWDSKKSKLLLARDRLGKKPLYYTIHENTLWFASELKSLIQAGVIKKEIDLDSLALYFRTDYIPTPKTIFKEVFKLEPGTFMSWENGKISKNKFWDYPIEDLSNFREDEILKELKNRIDKSVSERLVSDVPLGLFLSGGLDSAVVAESAGRQNLGLQAFTLGFEDSSHDETELAKITAEKFGLKHHIEILSEEKAISIIEDAVSVLDEPLADPSILPTLLLSQFTRKHVTVSLSGDGGDELLLGYQHVPAHIWLERFNFLPINILNRLADLIAKIHSTSDYFSFGFKLQRLSRGLSIKDRYDRDLAWRGSFDRKGLKKLLRPDVVSKLDWDEPVNIMKQYAKETPEPNSWSAWSWSYLRTFLMDDVMVKVDRATMWNSLEARAPLLDYRVVSFLLNLPDKYKLGSWGGKRLFKELLKDRLPDDIINAPKHGFGVPTAKWLNSTLHKELLDLSEPEFLNKQNLFNREYILEIINEHKTGIRDKRKELWAYFMFQKWYIKWYKN